MTPFHTWLQENWLYPEDSIIILLRRAYDIASWHMEDNDDCGEAARALMHDISAFLKEHTVES